jgi:dolichol kinase
MKTLCAAVLAFESIILLLVIPVAIQSDAVSPVVGIAGGVILMVAAIYLSAAQRRKSWALTAGWVMQAILVLLGFLVPIMFFLGAVFAILWFYAIRVGRQGDAIKAAREAQDANEPDPNVA